MQNCDCCNKSVMEGYLVYDYHVLCEECKQETYTQEEYEQDFEEGYIFWTTFED